VRTISEQIGFEEIFFSKVVSHLFQQGLPTAAPLSTLDGICSTMFCGKPTFLQPRLEGSHLVTVNEDHYFQIGEFVGNAQTALGNLRATRMNPYHLDWMQSTLSSISDRLNELKKTQLTKLLGDYEDIGTLVHWNCRLVLSMATCSKTMHCLTSGTN